MPLLPFHPLSPPSLPPSQQEVHTTATRQRRKQPCTNPLRSPRSITPISIISLWLISSLTLISPLALIISLLRPIVHSLLLLWRAVVLLLRRSTVVGLWRPVLGFVVRYGWAVVIWARGLWRVVGAGGQLGGWGVAGWRVVGVVLFGHG